jgi:hypothetical protein
MGLWCVSVLTWRVQVIVDGRVIQETYGVGQFPLNNYVELVVPVTLGTASCLYGDTLLWKEIFCGFRSFWDFTENSSKRRVTFWFIFGLSEKCELISVHMEILYIDYSTLSYFNPLISYVAVINETMVSFIWFWFLFWDWCFNVRFWFPLLAYGNGKEEKSSAQIWSICVRKLLPSHKRPHRICGYCSHWWFVNTQWYDMFLSQASLCRCVPLWMRITITHHIWKLHSMAVFCSATGRSAPESHYIVFSIFFTFKRIDLNFCFKIFAVFSLHFHLQMIVDFRCLCISEEHLPLHLSLRNLSAVLILCNSKG